MSSSDPYYNSGAPSGTLVAAPDNETPSQTATVYDGAGRPTASIAYHFASETWRTTTAYPGSDRVDVTPPDGDTPTTTYTDARGQTVKLLRYHGSTPTGAADTVTYSYDAAGHQIGQDDGRGHTWSSHYDLLGRRTSQTDPDTGSSSSTYDNAGQLLTTTDNRGKTISYAYDEMGRKTAEYDTTGGVDPAPGNELAAWTYDTLKKGKPTSSTRYVGGTSGTAYTSKVLGYDSHGWVQATELVVPSSEGALAGTYIHQNRYNLTGTLKSYTDQDPTTVALPEETVSYTYDAYDRPIGVGGDTNGWAYVSGLTYTEFDEPQQYTYGTSGNFAQQTLSYDDQTHRLLGSTTVTQSGHAIADQTQYAYQPSGNVTKISDKLETGQTDTQCFSYDWAQRLKAAWTATDDCAATPAPGGSSTVGGPNPYWQSWTYDDTGARQTQVDHDPSGDTSHDTTATYTPFTAGKGPAHAVAQVDKVTPGDPTASTTNTYTYDEDGNVLTRTTRAGTDTFTYDDEGKLADLSSTGSAGDTKYLYDADGSLLIRRSPDGTTLYTGDEELTVKKGASSADGVRYISLAGETVATHSSDGHFTYLIPDRQGTGTLAIDAQTQAVTRRQYKPFGEERDQTGAWTAGQRGYVGGTQDDNTGLTNLGAREYDPSIGRFLAPDPLLDTGDPQSWNAYDYADDTPVTSSDPSGLCMADQCGVGYPIGGTGTSKSNPKRYVDTGPVDPGGSNPVYCHHGNCTDGHRLGQGEGANGGNGNTQKDQQAEARAAARAKATADAAVAAAKKQASGLKNRILSLVADVIGLTDAYNCFTKGDVMGCVNTALTAVPWGKVFKAIKVGIEAFKVWRALDRAYTAVKDAEEAAKIADGVLDTERALAEAREAESAGTEAIGCSVHSFVPGTAVRLADGSSKPIGHIKTGDTVLATDPQTGVTAPEKVQNVIVTKTDRDFTTLTLDTTPVRGPPHTRKHHAHTLTTTWHHPFWDAGHHRWTDAHDLTPGTRLRQPDGTTVLVSAVHNFHQHRTTYDLTVGNLHTYYVLAGATPVLVHNCGEAAEAASEGPQSLYHYTNEAGHDGIISSGEMRPSLKANNPKDARYGDGQYLTDIKPGTKTLGQLSAAFLRVPWAGRKFTHYIEIDVRGLDVVEGRPGVFVIPNSGSLDLTGRILSSGRN